MGYSVTVECEGVCVPSTRVRKALSAIKELMLDELTSDYSWVDRAEALKAVKHENLVAALRAWRYEAEEGDLPSPVEQLAHPDQVFRSVNVYYFSGEKWGDDEDLWRALAPFLQSGGVITFYGEDRAAWRYLFEHGKMTEQHGEYVFL
ncbi:hypothetical protein CMI37_16490 [Candidatus Pacearchaeota archaeon]|nr:hypothetical protein [Candidatus Pacearchaeota archaeon]|tara:strand:- start:49 stop:492 length:444 start_codon:yes stop_codon:yes gene_type:complete